jgi:hypothetical protein
VEEKRRELLAARRIKWRETSALDPALRELDVTYRAYEEEDAIPSGFTEEDLARRDIAPLPPEESEVVLRFGKQNSP